MMRYALYKPAAAVLFCFCAAALFPPAAGAQSAGTRIERIVFTGNRTSERLLRRRLPFSEGDLLLPGSLKEARTALWDMHQFKSVEVSSAALPGGGAEIGIVLKDGWYLLPIPIFTAGGGGGRGGFVLSGMNIFRQGESITAFGFSGSAGSSAALALRRGSGSIRAAVRRSDFTERLYSDGAFSALSGSGRPPDAEDPSEYGTVASSYRKVRDSAALSAGLPLLRASGRRPALSAEAGWERSRLKYSDPSPSAPGDAGRQGEAFVSLHAGRREGGRDSLGAIFGFGLADMERRLAPLPEAKFSSGADLSWHGGGKWSGSDPVYGYLLARWNGSLTWGTHRSISLTLAGGGGEDLPPGRMPATGRDSGLSGTYAREFRGNSAAGASLMYSHPFRITRKGLWQGALFAETARAWGSAYASGSKAGAGASFWYRFWRFPLPFGFSCTYSFDDRDAQFSAAIGGRF